MMPNSLQCKIDDIINVAAHRLSTGALEQAITSHPRVTEACVVGIPDLLKGHLPFAFVVTTTSPSSSSPGSSPTTTAAVPDPHEEKEKENQKKLFAEIQTLVRSQVGPIASLGGMIQASQGQGMIPKTRSGKTLRRVLRELVENAVHGKFDKEVSVPSTVEDASVVEVARRRVRAYFTDGEGREKEKAKL